MVLEELDFLRTLDLPNNLGAIVGYDPHGTFVNSYLTVTGENNEEFQSRVTCPKALMEEGIINEGKWRLAIFPSNVIDHQVTANIFERSYTPRGIKYIGALPVAIYERILND